MRLFLTCAKAVAKLVQDLVLKFQTNKKYGEREMKEQTVLMLLKDLKPDARENSFVGDADLSFHQDHTESERWMREDGIDIYDQSGKRVTINFD